MLKLLTNIAGALPFPLSDLDEFLNIGALNLSDGTNQYRHYKEAVTPYGTVCVYIDEYERIRHFSLSLTHKISLKDFVYFFGRPIEYSDFSDILLAYEAIHGYRIGNNIIALVGPDYEEMTHIQIWEINSMTPDSPPERSKLDAEADILSIPIG